MIEKLKLGFIVIILLPLIAAASRFVCDEIIFIPNYYRKVAQASKIQESDRVKLRSQFKLDNNERIIAVTSIRADLDTNASFFTNLAVYHFIHGQNDQSVSKLLFTDIKQIDLTSSKSFLSSSYITVTGKNQKELTIPIFVDQHTDQIYNSLLQNQLKKVSGEAKNISNGQT